MNGFIGVSDTASDVIPGSTGPSEPLPTTIDTPSGKLMVDWPSVHTEAMRYWSSGYAQWLRGRLARPHWVEVSNAVEPCIEQPPQAIPKPYGLMTVSEDASDFYPVATGASDALLARITTQSHTLMVGWRPSPTETMPYWFSRHVHSLQCDLNDLQMTVVNAATSPLVHTYVEQEPQPVTAKTGLMAWFACPEIDPWSTHEVIIPFLRLQGRSAVADRLIYLRGLAQEDPDESAIELASLRMMAHFLMSERQLPDPWIGVTRDGFIQIEWRVLTDGILAMEFLPSGLIHFAAVSGPGESEADRLSVSGTLPKAQALAAVQPFTAFL